MFCDSLSWIVDINCLHAQMQHVLSLLKHISTAKDEITNIDELRPCLSYLLLITKETGSELKFECIAEPNKKGI